MTAAGKQLAARAADEFEACAHGLGAGPSSPAAAAALAAYRERAASLGPLAARAIASVAPGAAWTAQLKGGERVVLKPPVYARPAEDLERARLRLREALERASILEHRALVTASASDAAAFESALGELRAAGADTWRLEALSAALAKEHVLGLRAAAAARHEAAAAAFAAAAGARDVAAMVEAGRDMHAARGVAQDARPIDVRSVSLLAEPPAVGAPQPATRAKRVARAAAEKRRAAAGPPSNADEAEADMAEAAGAAGMAAKQKGKKLKAARRKIRKARG